MSADAFWREHSPRILVLLYGALNALLYTNLLPLWEGFDEPFHYGYVAHLARKHSLPVLGTTALPDDVARSLQLTPASSLVGQRIPGVTVFEDYFRQPAGERTAKRLELAKLISSDDRVKGGLNYEAQQAPLAYGILACFDALWEDRPLLERVLRLRMLAALVSALATGIAVIRLSGMLGASAASQALTAFLVFSSQMFYATIAHIGNDWLAVPLFSMLAIASVALWQRPDSAHLSAFALVLSAGLWTKAYFLAAVPFGFALVSLLLYRRKVRAGQALMFALLLVAIGTPWYARNLVRMGNFTGMQETAHGLPVAALFKAALAVPWPRTLWSTSHWVMWAGNNSMTAFSTKTVNTMLLLLLAALIVYAANLRRKGFPYADRCVIGLLLSFGCGLIYYSVLAFWSTNGVGIGPSPSYVEPAMPPLLCLLCRRLPRFLELAMLWVWTYVIAATFAVKLVPYYGGFRAGHIRAVELVHWYGTARSSGFDLLGTTAAGPLSLVLWLLAAVMMATPALAVWLSLWLRGSERTPAEPVCSSPFMNAPNRVDGRR